MTNAERIIAAAHAALDAGPLGDKQRPAAYRTLVSCGFRPALAAPFETADIGTIRTSCAVFVRGVLHAAGRRATRPGKVGQGIMGGWLEGLTTSHPAWEWAVDAAGKPLGRRPPPAAVFYRDYSRNFGKLGHVGFLLFEVSPGQWITAEGGGGDGTECKLSNGPKDFFGKDVLNRIPIGWWRPELLDGFSGTAPPAPDPTGTVLTNYAACRLGDRDPPGTTDGPVRTWQRRLLAAGQQLPKYGADGDYGQETLVATRALILAAHDGTLVDEYVWNLTEKKQ